MRRIMSCCFGLLFMVCIMMIGGTVSTADVSEDGVLPDLARAEWLVLGPFGNPPGRWSWSECQGFGRDYLSDFGGESKAQPRAGQEMKYMRTILRWVTCRAEGGQVDFHRLFPDAKYCLAYAYLEVASPREQTVALKFGSDDGAKIWCNGKPICSRHVHEPLRPDTEAVRLDLQAGTNRLLVKVDQGNGAWGFAARLRSLADEQQEWANVQSPGLQVCLENLQISEASQARCMVKTLPALAIRERVDLSIRDLQGKLLAEQTGWTGELLALSLPSGFTGAFLVQAAGNGQHAKIGSLSAVALVGEVEQIKKNVAVYAREVAERLPTATSGEDVPVTLTFLADQLDGKLHATLSTADRNFRAILAICELCVTAQNGPWQVGMLRGLRPWAYRSAVDGSAQPYTLYLPERYDARKKYGLIVTLHGFTGDEYGQAWHLGKLHPEDFIVVAPFGRGDLNYCSIGELDVLEVLDRVQRTYSVDPDRTYLTGTSMGGYGAWRIGQFFADRFAAIAPFCGGYFGAWYLENLRNLPVLIVHGDADPLVPAQVSREAAARLKELNYQVRYDELPGVDHDAWGNWIMKDGNRLFEYFRQYRRNPWPKRVDLRANWLRYGRQYWVEIEELYMPLRPGYIGAEVVDAKHIRVETKEVTAFTLDLRHPGLTRTGRIALDINGTQLWADAGQTRVSIAYVKDLGWTLNAPEPPPAVVHNNGGGAADLFYGPVTIIYGTGKADRVEALRRLADRIADWSPTIQSPNGSKTGRFRVKADTDITEADMRDGNLLLLGSPAENRLTSGLADKLPVRILGNGVEVAGQKFPGAGLLLTYPNPLAPKRLVGILSLPSPYEGKAIEQFTTVTETVTGIRQFLIYQSTDVIVFGPPDLNPIWRGCFDRHWQQLIPYQ